MKLLFLSKIEHVFWKITKFAFSKSIILPDVPIYLEINKIYK